MRWHAHDRTIAVTYQHIVTHPHIHRFTGQGMRYPQAGVHAFFLLRGQFSFSRAARLAFGDKCSQRRVQQSRLHRQRMLRRNRHKSDAHDRVSAGGEHIHPAIANEIARSVFVVVRKGKAHAHAFAYPVFLHEFDPLGPAGQLLLHAAQQFIGVVGNF